MAMGSKLGKKEVRTWVGAVNNEKTVRSIY